MKLIFCLQLNIKGFFKLILLLLAKHARITQNNKFTISLQYLKKEISDDVDLLHADKHESFLQLDAMNFDGTQWAFTCSKLTIETLEQGVKYVQN